MTKATKGEQFACVCAGGLTLLSVLATDYHPPATFCNDLSHLHTAPYHSIQAIENTAQSGVELV